MEKIKKSCFMFVCLVIFSFIFSGLVGAQPDKVFELSYATPVGPDHTFSIVDKKWFSKIEQESNGRIKIKPYWAGTLIGGREAIDEVAKGIADIGFISPGYARSGYDFVKRSFLFFTGANQSIGRKVFKDMMKKFPEIEREYKGLKVLSWSSGVDYQLLSRKPVRKLADLKGMRIKTIGELVTILAKFGAEGTSTPTPEVFVSLQKGLLDGTLTPYEAFKSLKLGEVIKYVTIFDIYRPHTGGRAMNLDTWNKLPKDIQEIFENNIEWYGAETDRIFDLKNDEGLKFAKELGVEFITLPEGELDTFYLEMKKVAEKQAEDLEKLGLPGRKMYQEAQALIR